MPVALLLSGQHTWHSYWHSYHDDSHSVMHAGRPCIQSLQAQAVQTSQWQTQSRAHQGEQQLVTAG
jgi:hypothetical protein